VNVYWVIVFSGPYSRSQEPGSLLERATGNRTRREKRLRSCRWWGWESGSEKGEIHRYWSFRAGGARDRNFQEKGGGNREVEEYEVTIWDPPLPEVLESERSPQEPRVLELDRHGKSQQIGRKSRFILRTRPNRGMTAKSANEPQERKDQSREWSRVSH